MSVVEATAPRTTAAGLLADLIRSVSKMADHAELLDAAPGMVARMGFDRAIVSQVNDGLWAPAAVYVSKDRQWARDIRDAGRNAPQRLGSGLVDDEMLGIQRPILVRHVQGNPRVVTRGSIAR